MGAFVISKRFTGEYKFVYTSRKGKVIFTSRGYLAIGECEQDIEVVRAISTDSCFTRHKTAAGKYYFKLIINEKLLAVSRKYTTELRVAKGINEILMYSGKSETLDFSENTFVFPDDEVQV
jgi:hypothetical protein